MLLHEQGFTLVPPRRGVDMRLMLTVSTPVMAGLLAVACAASRHSPPVSPDCLRTETPSADTTIYPLDSLDYRSRPEWTMPQDFEAATAVGSPTPAVEGEAVIETDGRIQARTIHFQHVDSPALAQFLTESLASGRSCPAMRHGVPVRSRVKIRLVHVTHRP
jgi:hypothetical protein